MNTTTKSKLKTIYESFVDTYKNNKKELKELSDEVDDLETKFSNDEITEKDVKSQIKVINKERISILNELISLSNDLISKTPKDFPDSREYSHLKNDNAMFYGELYYIRHHPYTGGKRRKSKTKRSKSKTKRSMTKKSKNKYRRTIRRSNKNK